MPRATVLIPAYQPNLEWLAEVISDLNSQQFQDFSVLIVDDGSSPALDAGWVQDRLKAPSGVLRLTENRGIIDALNAGLAQVDSEFIMRMDADDRMHPERFSRQIEFMEHHSNVGICGTEAVRFGQRHDTFGVPTDHVSIATELLFINPMCHPTVCFRSESIAGLYYPQEVLKAEDYLFWSVAAAAGVRFANLKLPLLGYRVSGSNSSAASRAERFERSMKVQNVLYQNLFGSPLPEFVQAAFDSGLHAILGGFDHPGIFTRNERVEYVRALHELTLTCPAFTDADLTLSLLLTRAWKPQSWGARKWRKIRGRYFGKERLDWLQVHP